MARNRIRAVLRSLALTHKLTIWRTEESRSRSSEILIAISMATLAARSYRPVSYLFFLLSGRPAQPPTFSALSAAERQMSRIRWAASISPIGHWMASSQTSSDLGLLNHRIATSLKIKSGYGICGRYASQNGGIFIPGNPPVVTFRQQGPENPQARQARCLVRVSAASLDDCAPIWA